MTPEDEPDDTDSQQSSVPYYQIPEDAVAAVLQPNDRPKPVEDFSEMPERWVKKRKQLE